MLGHCPLRLECRIWSWHKYGHLSEGSFVQNVVVQIPKFDAKPNPNSNPNLALTLTQSLALTLCLYFSDKWPSGQVNCYLENIHVGKNLGMLGPCPFGWECDDMSPMLCWYGNLLSNIAQWGVKITHQRLGVAILGLVIFSQCKISVSLFLVIIGSQFWLAGLLVWWLQRSHWSLFNFNNTIFYYIHSARTTNVLL